MQYQGPTSDDLANIGALNYLYINVISGQQVKGPASDRLARLTDAERVRLAHAPFLLFSLREQDSAYWQRLFDGGSQIDLIDPANPADERIAALQMAGLSFLWQLVRRNPYAARIVSGAPVSWCDRLASLTLVSLLQRAASTGDLLCMRFAVDDIMWQRLLGNGVSAKRELRLAAHHCALQTMLARGPARHPSRMAAAACSMQSPRRRDHGRFETGVRNTKV